MVQLMDGDNPVSYFIDSIENWIYDPEKKCDFKWVQMIPDRSVKKVKEFHKAGILSFKLAIHDLRLGDVNFLKHPSWARKVPKRSNPVKIRCYIYQCRDLPAADAEGTSDPYIEIWDTGSKPKKTEVVEDNNNPLFYEVIELDYEVFD